MKLEEGSPPEHYREWKRERSPHELMEEYLAEQRQKNIPYDLDTTRPGHKYKFDTPKKPMIHPGLPYKTM